MTEVEIEKILRRLMNIIRVGQVSSVNEIDGTVRVKFNDKDELISPELPLMDAEYNIPEIGDQVLCLFLPNGLQQGFCLNGFYSDVNKTPIQNRNIFFKKLDANTSIEYNKATKELTVNSSGTIKVNGNVQVTGNINATGKVTASNITG